MQRILDTDVTKHYPNSTSVRNAFGSLDGQGNLAANQLLMACSCAQSKSWNKREFSKGEGYPISWWRIQLKHLRLVTYIQVL